MKILFRQSGGLLGSIRTCDTDCLSPTDAAEAKKLFCQSGITSSVKCVSPKARDANVYELTVSEANGSYQITIDDASMTEELAPLIDLLLHHAKPVKR